MTRCLVVVTNYQRRHMMMAGQYDNLLLCGLTQASIDPNKPIVLDWIKFHNATPLFNGL